MLSQSRLRELAGFNAQQDQINNLKESRIQLLAAHDLAIAQAEKGLQIDEGFFTGMAAAFNTALSGTKMASKAVVKKAAALSDKVKTIYMDEKAKIELKNLVKGVKGIAGTFEKLEKEISTLLSKDQRIAEIVKVFADALNTLEYELVARMIPEKIDPTLGEDAIKKLVDDLLSEVKAPTGNAKKLYSFVCKNHDQDIEVSKSQMEDLEFAEMVSNIRAGKTDCKFTGKFIVK